MLMVKMALNDDGTAKLVFISYNMHGYNQGIVAIQHLIDTVAPAAYMYSSRALAHACKFDSVGQHF